MKSYRKLFIISFLAILMLWGGAIWGMAYFRVADIETQENKVILTMVYSSGDDMTRNAITTIVEAFQEEYPYIEIRQISSGTMIYSDFLKYQTAAGQFPDIVEMRDSATYIDAGMLEPLPDEILALFDNPPLNDGVGYVAPLYMDNTLGILYNKVFFAEHGINEAPESYQEFQEICRQCKALGMNPLAVGGGDLWHIGFLFDYYLNSYVLRKNPDFIKSAYSGESQWTDADCQQALGYMQQMFQEYVIPEWPEISDNQIVDYLITGEAAMIYTGTQMINTAREMNKEFEIGWFPIPQEDGNIHLVAGMNNEGWALSKAAAENEEKKAAFLLFIQFFYDEHHYRQFLQQTNRFSALKEPVGVTYHNAPIMNAIESYINGANSLSPIWNSRMEAEAIYSDFRNDTYRTITEILKGEVTIKDGSETIQSYWNKYLR